MSEPTQQIIRIDKGDGSESVELTDDRVKTTIHTNYPAKDFNEVLENFYYGMTVYGRFANYELREKSK